MALKNLIKENLVLVIGLTLPVLLIALFFLATVLPRSLATPPQYEMVFSYDKYEYNNPPAYNTQFIVRDGRLMAVLAENAKPQQNYNVSHLMIYDGKTESVREISYVLPKVEMTNDRTEILVEEMKNFKIDTSSKSPDGYEFNYSGYGHGGIATDIFVGGSYRNNYSIRKGAVAFKVNMPRDQYYYYNNLKFIGWIVEKK